MSAATLEMPTMPPMPSVGLAYMSAVKKPRDDAAPRKHSFDSDDEVTAILHAINRIGISKTAFINLCIQFAAERAFESLSAEQKSFEQGFRQLLARKYKAQEKP